MLNRELRELKCSIRKLKNNDILDLDYAPNHRNIIPIIMSMNLLLHDDHNFPKLIWHAINLCSYI